MRKIVVVFQFNDGRQKIAETVKGKKLTDLLEEHDIYVDKPCSGLGHCGKCRVRFYSGETAPTDSDRRYITGQELDEGYRLACRVVLKEDCVIELPAQLSMDEDMDIVDADEDMDLHEFDPSGVYGIGLDIGTTTLAAALVRLDQGDYNIISQSSCVNHQRKYGADVISRIQSAIDGKGREMRESILRDIQSLFTTLIMETDCSAAVVEDRIKTVTIAGNTTMLHILMGYPCDGLGSFPYNPHNLDPVCSMACFVLPGVTAIREQTKVTVLPGISAFVGADILSGLYALGFDEIPPGQYGFMLDLGTNGEMAVGNRNHLYVASTAAGPVFEGGSISRGCPSVTGAICHVTIEHDKPIVETIGGEKAVGICGTGVLETVSQLRVNGIIDETGLLREEYFEKGYCLTRDNYGKSLFFTQSDVRQVQLAKAAIKAGIDMLLKESGLGDRDKVDKIAKIYIAGGFGYRIRKDSLYHLNMLPESFTDKIESPGNTSLLGTLKYMVNEFKEPDSGRECLDILIRASREVELATDESFGGAYYDAINF